jgi:16S rRNA (cytosine1402-N4)-methyltransferase
MHTPVLFQEVREALNVQPSKQYIDATLGEGGFTRMFAEEGGDVLAIDWDNQQIEQVQRYWQPPANVVFAEGNYADIENIARTYGFTEVDGVLFDLGLSMNQIAESGRGFTYKNPEEPLDMRINRGTTPVSEYINSYTFEDLYEIVSRYSEELNSRAIVQALVRARTVKKIETVGDLIRVIDQVLHRQEGLRQKEREQIYARIFQAFRIAANDEFSNIRNGIQGAVRILSPEGRIAVISFHSLEDRIVKIEGRRLGLRMKEIRPKRDVKSFERSARLRILQHYK